MNNAPSDHVITDVSVITTLTFVPPNFRAITCTFGGTEDANLARDRLLSKKSRYLCVKSERFADCQSTTPVLVALTLINDGSTVPVGYTAINYAYGTGERAFKKKIICAKYQSLGLVGSAVCEIIIRSRSQRALTGYTLVGEINSLLIMYSTTPVPKPDSVPSGTSPGSSLVAARVSGNNSPQRPPFSNLLTLARGNDASSTPPIKPRGPIHPLSGVPFELNKKYFRDDTTDTEGPFGSFIIKTAEQIENEYQYRFTVERSILQSCPN